MVLGAQPAMGLVAIRFGSGNKIKATSTQDLAGKSIRAWTGKLCDVADNHRPHLQSRRCLQAQNAAEPFGCLGGGFLGGGFFLGVFLRGGEGGGSGFIPGVFFLAMVLTLSYPLSGWVARITRRRTQTLLVEERILRGSLHGAARWNVAANEGDQARPYS